jgi:hypothetical protein
MGRGVQLIRSKRRDITDCPPIRIAYGQFRYCFCGAEGKGVNVNMTRNSPYDSLLDWTCSSGDDNGPKPVRAAGLTPAYAEANGQFIEMVVMVVTSSADFSS